MDVASAPSRSSVKCLILGRKLPVRLPRRGSPGSDIANVEQWLSWMESECGPRTMEKSISYWFSLALLRPRDLGAPSAGAGSDIAKGK